MRHIDLTGKKFNYLTIKSQTRSTRKGERFWLCECICGRSTILSTDHITRKKQPVKSCGCKKISKGNTHKQWSGIGEISGSWWRIHVTREIFNKSNRHRLSCTVTIQEAWDLFLKQNKKCALSGVDLQFGAQSKNNSASLDRIDNSKGYELSNIQWVHKHINFMKRDLEQSYFIEMCKKVTEINK